MHATGHFLDRLTAIAPPVATFILSAAIGVIAWLQWRVAKNKLRLDLYDRRYKVYEATREFLRLVLRNANVEPPEYGEFFLATSDAGFLFGPDVVDKLAEIRKEALHLRTSKILLERPQDDAEVKRLALAVEEKLEWLTGQIDGVAKVFGRYLGFAHIK